MKFLFDENLSHKLVRLLADLFPDSVHVRDVGLKAADDSEVWKYAQDNSLIICSKDSNLTSIRFTDVVNAANVLVAHLSRDAHFTMKPREGCAVS
jgi:predicted nuclease of predicted toxin-antitoxin system